MGIDYGKKRVGVALSNESNEFALPHSIIQNNVGMSTLVEKVCEICRREHVTDVVIGESKDYSGKENPIMKDIWVFADALEVALSEESLNGERVKIHYEPEFMTSAEAERVVFRRQDKNMERTGVKPNNKEVKNEMLDASAAALILKHFLERKK